MNYWHVSKRFFVRNKEETRGGDDSPDDPSCPVERPGVTDEVPYLVPKKHGNDKEVDHRQGVF